MPDTPVPSAATGSREIAEALGFEPDNHHNALLCPYCGGGRAKIEAEIREQVAREIEAERERIASRPIVDPTIREVMTLAARIARGESR